MDKRAYKGFAAITVLSVLLGCSGCASVVQRGYGLTDYKVYPATRIDLTMPEEGSYEGKGGLWKRYGGIWWIVTACCAIDLPFSLATDTVLLPWDLTKLVIRR